MKIACAECKRDWRIGCRVPYTNRSVNERPATGRIKIVRIEKGKTVEVKVKLTDIVRPGVTIVVPERFF